MYTVYSCRNQAEERPEFSLCCTEAMTNLSSACYLKPVCTVALLFSAYPHCLYPYLQSAWAMTRGWRGSSVVKKTYCPYREPGYSSQHPRCGLQPSLIPGPEDLTLFWPPQELDACTWMQQNTNTENKYIWDKFLKIDMTRRTLTPKDREWALSKTLYSI